MVCVFGKLLHNMVLFSWLVTTGSLDSELFSQCNFVNKCGVLLVLEVATPVATTLHNVNS